MNNTIIKNKFNNSMIHKFEFIALFLLYNILFLKYIFVNNVKN